MNSIPSIINILENCLLNITFSESDQEFVNCFKVFKGCIQNKQLENINDTIAQLNLKLKKKRNKEEQKRQHVTEQREKFEKDLNFKENIILENCALIIQQQQQHNDVLKKEREVFDHEIFLSAKELQNKKKKSQQIIQKNELQYEQRRLAHLFEEDQQRVEWLKTKQTLNDVLLKYDNEMFNQQNQIESVQTIINAEKEKLQYYRVACALQESTYFELMKEKEEYLESEWQKQIYEMRVRFARRTIVKFIEQNYPAWKKRKLKAIRKKGKSKYFTRSSPQKKAIK